MKVQAYIEETCGHCCSRWVSGTLRDALVGPYGSQRMGYAIDLTSGGNVVFPLGGRKVEVYASGDNEPCITTDDMIITQDLSRRPRP